MHRSSIGVSIIELALALIIAVPVVLALFEMIVLILVVQATDSVAQESARVAAGGDPRQAEVRAQMVVNKANQDQHFMSSRMTLAECSFNPASTLNQEASMIPYGGTVNGDVTVQIRCHVKPWLISLVTNNRPIVFNSQKTFPFTYNIPNTAGGIAPAP